MTEAKRRRWRKGLIALAVILLAAWGFDRLGGIYWVGRTDLEVEFVVTEAGSDRPVPGARIEVRSEGGFYEEREKQEFVLHADGGGAVSKVYRSSMCFGKRSGLGFTDTFAVHRPWWLVRVSAEGYQRSEWLEVNSSEYARQVRRIGPGKAKVTIPVALRKNPT
jgi:hypothetical protein